MPPIGGTGIGKSYFDHRSRTDRVVNARVYPTHRSNHHRDGYGRIATRFLQSTYNVPYTVQFKGDGSELEQMKEITKGDMYEVVTDATGNNRSMSNALQYVAHSGSLVYVGITTDEVSFPHPGIASPRDDSQGVTQRPPRRLHSNHRADRRRHNRHESLDHTPHILRRRHW